MRGHAGPGWPPPFGERDDVVRVTCGVGSHSDQARLGSTRGVSCAHLHLILGIGLQIVEGEVGERRLEPETPCLRSGLPSANDIGQPETPLGFEKVAVLHGQTNEPGRAVPLDTRFRLSSRSHVIRFAVRAGSRETGRRPCDCGKRSRGACIMRRTLDLRETYGWLTSINS